VIESRVMHSRADYDPFEGFEVTGWPKLTISRGATIASERKVDAPRGRGEFVARARFSPDWRSL
jgi:dihydropyrimidinase